MEAVGWRAVFVALAAITFAVAVPIFIAVPEQGGAGGVEGLPGQVAAIIRIYRDPAFWKLAPLLATTAGSHIAIQTLWAGPWFRDVAGLPPIGVANYLMVRRSRSSPASSCLAWSPTVWSGAASIF